MQTFSSASARLWRMPVEVGCTPMVDHPARSSSTCHALIPPRLRISELTTASEAHGRLCTAWPSTWRKRPPASRLCLFGCGSDAASPLVTSVQKCSTQPSGSHMSRNDTNVRRLQPNQTPSSLAITGVSPMASQQHSGTQSSQISSSTRCQSTESSGVRHSAVPLATNSARVPR